MSSHLQNCVKKAKRVFCNQRGQGLVEYALILVLISLVAIVAMTGVGTKVSSTFTNVTAKMP
jgi:pilus assembly protein Flp/PilA